MLKVSGNIINISDIANEYKEESVERKIAEILISSKKEYKYSSMTHLKFEIDLRMKIINASRELNKSGFRFKVFRDSLCNTDYWERTDEGGFLIKKDMKPREAINDIFKKGSKYGNECATAIVIIYYKAVCDMLPENLFNEMFQDIQLMDWQYIDSDLGIEYYRNLVDYLPGDCRYFKNPDVDPTHPEWQGENVIDLGNGSYYGHGAGIKKAEGIIKMLNNLRKENATESAYLLNSATRLDFNYLAEKYINYISKPVVHIAKALNHYHFEPV